MAATSVCQVFNSVFGNQGVKVFSCTLGANKTMAFDAGCGDIKYILWSATSSTTNTSIQVKKNVIADGTATSGYVAITGCTDGDDITVVVFAKR